MNSGCTFTVFTPTFNRAHTLPRAFAGLRAQTLRDFEWLIIDDGSTDGTRALVEQWQRAADFPIRYIWKENGGKHTAHNRALEEARGRFLFTLDSDDTCFPDALAQMLAAWESIPPAARSDFAFVSGLCVDEQGQVIGDPYPASPLDTTVLELIYRLKVRGDKSGCVVTEIARCYPFPILAARTQHIPEGAVWTAIGLRYRSRCVNVPLCRVYLEPGSLSRPAGSRAEVARRIAPGFTVYYAQVLTEHGAWLWAAPGQFVRCATHYVRYALHQRLSLREQWSVLRTARARLLWAVALPMGILVWLRDRLAREPATPTRSKEPP